ncbi:MAG: hypothetical protein ABEK29_02510 [Bradymonadaceae bacterium]
MAVSCLLTGPASAAPGDLAIGVKGGFNWSRLEQPNDPIGSPTLMQGTAFEGVGGTVGPTAAIELGTLAGGPFSLELDALYSRHVGHGSQENDESGARRDATLTTDVVRVPLLAKWQLPSTESSPILVGLGSELWAGFRSGAKVIHNEAVEAPPQPLRTTPVRHLALTALLGFEIPAGPNRTIPLELRTSWDPMVAPTTAERFRGYQSQDNPGEFEVAFDYHVIAMTGFTWSGF